MFYCMPKVTLSQIALHGQLIFNCVQKYKSRKFSLLRRGRKIILLNNRMVLLVSLRMRNTSPEFWNVKCNSNTNFNEKLNYIRGKRIHARGRFLYRTLFANLTGSTKKLANKIIYTYNISN